MFALSTQSRVRILACLLTRPHTVSELGETLPMELSAVSHQLRVLRHHALVRVEDHGRQRIYTLSDHHFIELLKEALNHANDQNHNRRVRHRRRAATSGA